MASWEPVDIDRDEIADEDAKWDDDAMNDLEKRFEELRNIIEILMKVVIRILERKRQFLWIFCI